MASLKDTVVKGLEELGLTLGEDRGALVISGVPGSDLKAQVRVDENERLVTIEALLCHPIEELTPELSLSLHYLNGHRAGLGYAFRESNRALVARSAWVSPTREPSDNQLQLMVSLLHQALLRDAPRLLAVAEGEEGWDAVAGDDAAGGGAEPVARSAMPTARMETPPASPEPPTRAWPGGAGGITAAAPSRAPGGGETARWSAFMDVANEADAAASAGWRSDAAAGLASGPATRRRTGKLDRRAAAGGDQDLADTEQPTRRMDAPEAGGVAEEPRRLSRQALAMAISQADQRGDAPKVDLARRPGGGVLRLLKNLIIAVVFLGGIGAIVRFFVLPFFPTLMEDITSSWQTATVGPEELKRQEREKVAPGQALLMVELQDPLTDPALHEANLKRSLEVLGDGAEAGLEAIIAREPGRQTRERAYQLWLDLGIPRDHPEARLRLLKQVQEGVPQGVTQDTIEAALLLAISQTPPPDAQLIQALGWAQGESWRTIVQLLGKPEDGSQERAEALTKQLSRDTPDLVVLNALMRTGHGPDDGARRLAEGLGAKWVEGDGRELLLRLAKSQPAAIEQLLGSENEDLRLATVGLLVEAGGPDASQLLCRVVASDAPMKVRMKAVIGLGALASPAVTWTLAQELGRPNEDPTITDEVRRALRKIPGPEAAEILKEHLAADRPLPERERALSTLQELHNTSAVQVIVERGIKDPDPKLRQRAFQILLEQQSEAKVTVSRALSTYRQMMQSDPDPQVRQLAEKLYKANLR